MNRFLQTTALRWTATCALAALPWSPSAAQEEVEPPPSGAGERLVPAALGIRTDEKGNSWNVEQNGAIGRIGSTMVNSGLALKVNDEKFVSAQPMMTADGKEFVLQGRRLDGLPGVQVQRRIKLMEEAGGLRYAELFYNGSADPVTLNVTLTTNFSGNYETFLTDRGRNEPVILESAESGILVLPGSTQSTRAFLFTLAGAGSDVKPTISAQNRYGLDFHYQLELAAGETGAIVHHVAQVVIPRNFDRRNLLRTFRPFSFAETAEHRPAAWRDFVVNGDEESADAPGPGLGARGVDALGVERGERDVLAIGKRTRLVGTAQGEDLAVAGSYGEATLPFDQVAAIVGERGRPGRQPKVYLRDGQIFSAKVEAPGLVFDQNGGDSIDIDMATLDRLVMAKADGDDDADPAPALIETYHGDRLEVSESASLGLTGVTAWGELPIRLEDLVWLGSTGKGTSGYRLRLDDGTSCLVYLLEPEIGLELDHFGDYKLSTNELEKIFTPKVDRRKRWDGPAGLETVLHLSGNQTLVGDVGNTVLPVASEGQSIETRVSEIRRLERVGDAANPGGIPTGSPLFRIERWDGGTLDGYLEVDVLSVIVAGRNWQVPVTDIERIEIPPPSLTPKKSTTIENLVDRLGSKDWGVRERATRELGAFGYLAEPVLRRALESAADPEVSRRLERVLAELN